MAAKQTKSDAPLNDCNAKKRGVSAPVRTGYSGSKPPRKVPMWGK